MSRLKSPREGVHLDRSPAGFPCFYGKKRLPRVITVDVWSFLKHASGNKLSKSEARKARAYIDQAYDFYEAAANPRQSSRPLLYYYALLNLGKVFLLHKNVNLPTSIRHGISEPRSNLRRRLRFEGQCICVKDLRPDHSELFPEIVHSLQNVPRTTSKYKIIKLLGQIPAIHRTYSSVMRKKGTLCPINKIQLLKDDRFLWARISFLRHDHDVKDNLKKIVCSQCFSDIFHQIIEKDDCLISYETEPIEYSKRWMDSAIGKLAQRVRECGVWTMITTNGYKYYLCSDAEEEYLPQFCSVYAVMFYLGSITRYKPYDFDKITSGYSWLINEFLDTQPLQALHCIASHIAQTEVVIPHAKTNVRL